MIVFITHYHLEVWESIHTIISKKNQALASAVSLVEPLNTTHCSANSSWTSWNKSNQTFAPWEIFHSILLSADFFKINFFEKFFLEYHLNVKQFGSRSGPTLCRAWSGSKLFAKVISSRHSVGNELTSDFNLNSILHSALALCFIFLLPPLSPNSFCAFFFIFRPFLLPLFHKSK